MLEILLMHTPPTLPYWWRKGSCPWLLLRGLCVSVTSSAPLQRHISAACGNKRVSVQESEQAAACTHTCSRLSRNHLCDFQQQKTVQPPTSALKEQLTHRSIASIPVLCGHRLNLSGRLLSTHLALHNFLDKLFLSFQDSTLPVPQ